jgi:hypothetical protein
MIFGLYRDKLGSLMAKARFSLAEGLIPRGVMFTLADRQKNNAKIRRKTMDLATTVCGILTQAD